MSKKIGLALGSGGSRGVTHVGAIKALEEAGIKPDYIAGCSMGAVVGACYAGGMTTEEMLKAVDTLKANKLMDLSVVPITGKSLLMGNKMQKLILSYVGDKNFEELNIPFRCVASDLYSGKLVVFSEGKVASAVRASSSMPTVFPPVKKDGMLLVDGGVLCRVPTRQVKEMGADVVIAVDALVNTGEAVSEVKNIFAVITRVYDMLDNRSQTMEKKYYGQEGEIWIEPPMEGMSQYKVKDLDRAYEEGYAAAKAKLPQILKAIEG